MSTYNLIRPSIFAIISTLKQMPDSTPPLFPDIIGTGFCVHKDGIVMTNRHVVDALERLPTDPRTGKRCGAVMAFGQPKEVERGGDKGFILPNAVLTIDNYTMLSSFGSPGRWFGQDVPDIGFLQVQARDVPAVRLASED